MWTLFVIDGEYFCALEMKRQGAFISNFLNFKNLFILDVLTSGKANTSRFMVWGKENVFFTFSLAKCLSLQVYKTSASAREAILLCCGKVMERNQNHLKGLEKSIFLAVLLQQTAHFLPDTLTQSERLCEV